MLIQWGRYFDTSTSETNMFALSVIMMKVTFCGLMLPYVVRNHNIDNLIIERSNTQSSMRDLMFMSLVKCVTTRQIVFVI